MKKYTPAYKSTAAAILVAIVFGIACYFEFERFKQAEQDALKSELIDLKGRVEQLINARIWSAYGVRALLENNNEANSSEITSYFRQIFGENDSILRNIAILKNTKIIYVYPLSKNEPALGVDLAKIPGQKETVLKVKNTQQQLISAPVQLVQSGWGIIARVPISRKSDKGTVYWGQISVVLDFNQFKNASGITEYMKKRNFAVYEKGGENEAPRILFGQIPNDPEQCVTVSSKLSGTNWIYTTQPKDGWQYFSQIFIILVFSGIFFSLGTARYVFQVVSSGIILAKSEGKFKTIFFDSADANLIIFQNRFIDCNNVTLSLLNAQREQILGKTPWDISPEIQPDGENSALKGARLLKQTIPDGGKKFEWVHERPDGTMLQVEVVLTAITIEDREVLFTTWRDIGERKKAEQELRTMNERLALISQVSNSIISAEPLANQVQRYSDLIKVVFKIDICIIRVISGNELVLLTSTGIEPAKVAGSMKIGFGLSGFLMEEKRALCINDMETHPLTSDYTYLIAGLYKGKSYAGAPILIKGEAIGVLGIYHIHEKREFRDVDLEHLQIIANNIAIVIENQGLYYNLESQNVKLEDELIERRRIEAELKAEKEKAEELHKVKSYFFSNMSHELRTPLQAILGYSQVIQQISVDETQCRMAGVIYQSGQRLSNTVKLILEISRLEADKIKPNVAAVDARSLVQEAFLINKPIASKKNLEMQYTTCETEALISVDSSLFVEILNLIIDNAIKFTPEGGIYVSVVKETEYVHISIKDSGIGISDSKMNVIFDEFRQESEGMGRSYEGTGLGLTLAKKYIELMDGVIKVESKLGEGTIFSIYFPLS